MPQAADLRNTGGNDWLYLSGEYSLQRSHREAVAPMIYLDMYAGSQSADSYTYDYTYQVWNYAGTQTLTLSTIGVGFGLKTTINPRDSLGAYLGIGSGVYCNTASQDFYDFDRDFGGTSDSSVQLGFKVEAGLVFNQRFVVEGLYENPGNLDDVNFDGASVNIGYRF